MNNLITITCLKIVFLSLIVLSLTIVNIFLAKKNVNSNYKYAINGVILIIIATLTSQFYNVIEGIFTLKYLSVKLYIVVLIITNIITIITLQKNIKLIYKIINYLFFIVISTILVINIMVITATKLNLTPVSSLQDAISLINISTIVLMFYLTIISITYIIMNLKDNKETPKEENVEVIKQKKERKALKLKAKNTSKEPKLTKEPKEKVSILTKKEKKSKSKKQTVLTNEQLLAYKNKQNFSINGVNASIIFEDSIPENIIKNYHLLLEDINNKLVNGYTLEENKLLKSICTKLETNNLNQIDINNLSILNKISIEEYNLLKKLYEQ